MSDINQKDNRLVQLSTHFNEGKEELKKNDPNLYYIILDILDGVKCREITDSRHPAICNKREVPIQNENGGK